MVVSTITSKLVSHSIVGNVWNKISSIPVTYPFAFGVVFSGMKTSFSDLLVQKVIERRDDIDWRRNSAFAAFGFMYLGGVQYMIYVPFFGRLFPSARTFVTKPFIEKIKDVKGICQALAQVLIDQCIHHPLMYFPAFYITKELVMNKNNPSITKCLNEYKINMKEDLLALWKIWVPCTIINFTFMPFHLRIPFTAGVSLVWTCILSIMRGGDIAHGTDIAGGSVTGATLHILEETIKSTTLFMEPIQLECNKSHVVLTASGPDRPGHVALLAQIIATNNGSITESKMVRLGHEFIILMHICIPPDKTSKQQLIKSLQNEKQLKSLNIRFVPITRRQTGTYLPPTSGVRIRCQGPDKPGMLASIAQALNERNLNLENVVTEIVQNKQRQQQGNGQQQHEHDFCITIDAVAIKYMDYEQIQLMVKDLETLKSKLNLDVLDIRVQRLQQPIDTDTD